MSPSRKIPKIMFSQHPDHASVPFWHDMALIKTHHELKECFILLSQFNGEEMMWDWEGKLVDDSVIERLLTKHSDFFQQNPIGKDVFITFRVPNPRIESGYRLGRAFMVMLQAHDLAKSVGIVDRPLFEVILPMTETATEMIAIRESYKRIAEATHTSFAPQQNGDATVEVIPIFESVPVILNAANILKTYIDLSREVFKQPITYIRPFLARSDPALNSGIVATTLAIKWALSEFARLAKEVNIPLYPITAPGALPFRGGLTPETVTDFLQEFAGIQTLVIQSAFRYDYDEHVVKQGIVQIQKNLTKKPISIPQTDYPNLIKTINIFETEYKKTIEELSPLINKISRFIPQRRERVQHIGLFGYSRQVGKHTLPRAIGFTASCYSLGIPPEIFGLGPALKAAQKKRYLPLLEKYYPGLKKAVKQAGYFLRKQSFKDLKLASLEKEIQLIEAYVGETLGPKTAAQKEHAEIVESIIKALHENKNPHDLIEKAAILRKSLG